MPPRLEMPRVFAPLPFLQNWKPTGNNLSHLFTTKEWNILDGVVCGLQNQQIALALHTTKDVIRNYLRVIFDKAGVSTRLELALWWMEHGYGRCEYPVKTRFSAA